MIYDTFEVKGNCKGCGKPTEWHINGDYPVCKACIEKLIFDLDFLKEMGYTKEAKEEDEIEVLKKKRDELDKQIKELEATDTTKIKRWDNGEVIYESKAKNIKEAVEEAVRKGISLAYANLIKANLYNADLTEANLIRANLYNADLYEANLTKADLIKANLIRANLYNADLYEANLTKANLIGCKMDKKVFDYLVTEWFGWEVVDEK